MAAHGSGSERVAAGRRDKMAPGDRVQQVDDNDCNINWDAATRNDNEKTVITAAAGRDNDRAVAAVLSAAETVVGRSSMRC